VVAGAAEEADGARESRNESWIGAHDGSWDEARGSCSW